jgi:hypothetical protein
MENNQNNEFQNEDCDEIFNYGQVHICCICSSASNQIGHHKAHLSTVKHENNKKQLREKMNLFYNRCFPIEEYYEKKFGIKHFDDREKFVKWRIHNMDEIRRHTVNPSEWYNNDQGVFCTPETCYKIETNLEPNTEEYYNWFVEKILMASETVNNIDKIPNYFITEKRTTEENQEVINIKNNIELYDIPQLIDLVIKTKKSYFIGLIIYKLYKGQYKIRKGFSFISNTNNNVDINTKKKMFVNINDNWVEDKQSPHRSQYRNALLTKSFKKIIKFFKDELTKYETIANAIQTPDENLFHRINDIECIIFTLKIDNKLCYSILSDALNTFFLENEPTFNQIKTFFEKEMICIKTIVEKLNTVDENNICNPKEMKIMISDILSQNKLHSSILKEFNLFFEE